MIFSCGEVIADLIEVDSGEYKFCVGGAPLNVSYIVNKLGGNVIFVGNVGDDILGKQIIDFVNESKLPTKYISIDKKRNTSMSFVTNSRNGERNFTFARKNGADYNIPLKTINLIYDANIVHIGSLLFSEKEGLEYTYKLIRKAKRAKKVISIDVNFRSELFETTAQAISTYSKILSKADIIKMSSEEIEIFSGTKDIYRGLKNLVNPNQKVFVTLGAEGSFLYCNNTFYKEPSIKVDAVDTTGAGDAFYGCILNEIDQFGYDKFFNNELIIRNALKKANICGAYSTTKKGSLANILTKCELDSIYSKFEGIKNN